VRIVFFPSLSRVGPRKSWQELLAVSMAFLFATCDAPKALCRGRADSPDSGTVEGTAKIADDIGVTTTAEKPASEPDAEPSARRNSSFDASQFAVDVLIQGGHRYRKYLLFVQASMAYRSALAQQSGNQEALDAKRELGATLSSSSRAPDPSEADWPPPPKQSSVADPADFSLDVIVQGAHQYFEQSHLEKASLAYTSALARQAKSEEALCGRVHTLHLLGRWEEATAACAGGLELVPGSFLLLSASAALQGHKSSASAKVEPVLEAKAAVEAVPVACADSEPQAVDVPKQVDVPTAKPKTKKTAKAKPKVTKRSDDDLLALKTSDPQLYETPLARAKRVTEDAKKLEFEQQVQCPACRTDDDYKKELALIKEKNRSIKEESVGIGRSGAKKQEVANFSQFTNSMLSANERSNRKEMFISFYKEQYARLAAASVDLTMYTEQNLTSEGLTIKNGHQPMPKPPEGSVELPPDFKQPVGVLTSEQLLRYDCFSQRMLICLHGDLFDVSERPDKYDKDGPYWGMVGHDITWGLVCANDAEIEFDKYYDIYKTSPEDKMEKQLQGLMSWWAFYWKEYGDPVGRLENYEKEWTLPTPPELSDACSIM